MSNLRPEHLNAGNAWATPFYLTEDNSDLVSIAPIPKGLPTDTLAVFNYEHPDGKISKREVAYTRQDISQLWLYEAFPTPTNGRNDIVSQLQADGYDVENADFLPAALVDDAITLVANPESLAYVGQITLSHANGNW